MHEGKVYNVEAFQGCPLTCQIIPMGKDYTIAVYGGELPHVGSVVMAQARPSLTGEGISATSSVLNGIGHKDEAVARRFAETIAIRGNCTAVCACGIHVDDITPMQLGQIQATGEKLLTQCLNDL
ncbi:MAG: hypothetical protein LUF92_02430 [Clostridiales bacterium]|nr:hypothetical protein [Clostridiales bacterium]